MKDGVAGEVSRKQVLQKRKRFWKAVVCITCKLTAPLPPPPPQKIRISCVLWASPPRRTVEQKKGPRSSPDHSPANCRLKERFRFLSIFSLCSPEVAPCIFSETILFKITPAVFYHGTSRVHFSTSSCHHLQECPPGDSLRVHSANFEEHSLPSWDMFCLFPHFPLRRVKICCRNLFLKPAASFGYPI